LGHKYTNDAEQEKERVDEMELELQKKDWENTILRRSSAGM